LWGEDFGRYRVARRGMRMRNLARFLWVLCLSMLVLLGASSTASADADVFSEIRVCVRDPRLKPSVRE